MKGIEMPFDPDKYLDKPHPDEIVEKTAMWIALFSAKAVKGVGRWRPWPEVCAELERQFIAIARLEIETYEERKREAKARRFWPRRLLKAWRIWRNEMAMLRLIRRAKAKRKREEKTKGRSR